MSLQTQFMEGKLIITGVGFFFFFFFTLLSLCSLFWVLRILLLYALPVPSFFFFFNLFSLQRKLLQIEFYSDNFNLVGEDS